MFFNVAQFPLQSHNNQPVDCGDSTEEEDYPVKLRISRVRVHIFRHYVHIASLHQGCTQFRVYSKFKRMYTQLRVYSKFKHMYT